MIPSAVPATAPGQRPIAGDDRSDPAVARWLRRSCVVLLAALLPFRLPSGAVACTTADVRSVGAAFDLTGIGILPPGYPPLPPESGVHTIPAVLLKAIGWVESGWHQFTPQGTPLVSFDFGYGIMQVTSGMAGAFGNVDGDLDPGVQSAIASSYRYNIDFGAGILATKWSTTPRIGDGNPSVLENWYYALWAYNGWGWVNNPNNPRFTRIGTPAGSLPRVPPAARS
jgi:hypothetical protein